MGTRLELHDVLKILLGSPNVYFQPPPDHLMSYPCIVYTRSNIRPSFGDNVPFKLQDQYSVTVIDQNPDSLIPKRIASLPQCIFERHYAQDGLNHDVFTLLY